VIATALRRACRSAARTAARGRSSAGLRRRCPSGLVYERNPGDTWAFTIVGDRLPVAAIIVIVYVGFVRAHPAWGVLTFGVLGALLVWTAPNRWGVGIALHYLSRVYWPDPQDPPARRPGPMRSRFRCTCPAIKGPLRRFTYGSAGVGRNGRASSVCRVTGTWDPTLRHLSS
jgi:hypothetical protein